MTIKKAYKVSLNFRRELRQIIKSGKPNPARQQAFAAYVQQLKAKNVKGEAYREALRQFSFSIFSEEAA
ncbi:MAG: hypothetical protein QXL10_01555 [Candidatus Bathyarchaeia archaeon]